MSKPMTPSEWEAKTLELAEKVRDAAATLKTASEETKRADDVHRTAWQAWQEAVERYEAEQRELYHHLRQGVSS